MTPILELTNIITDRDVRRIARQDRARAARLGEARRVHKQISKDPLMVARREG